MVQQSSFLPLLSLSSLLESFPASPVPRVLHRWDLICLLSGQPIHIDSGLRTMGLSPLTPNTPLHTNRLLVGKNFWDSKSTLWWDGGCEAAHVWPGCQAEDWLSVLSLTERATQRDSLADRAHSPPPSPLEPLKGSQACAGPWSPGVTAGRSFSILARRWPTSPFTPPSRRSRGTP